GPATGGRTRDRRGDARGRHGSAPVGRTGAHHPHAHRPGRPDTPAQRQGSEHAQVAMRRAIFWSAVGSIVYTYLGFPVILALRAALFPRPWRRAPIEPSVSLIVVAHNEARGIEAKLA